MDYRIAYVQGGCAVFHEVDDILTEVRCGIPHGKVLTEEEAKAYKALLEKKGLGTAFESDVVRFTSIVLSSATHGPVSVRAHSGWMGDVEINAYLDGIEGHLDEETHVLFARIALHADIGECDGGWVSAYRRNGRWDLASGGPGGVKAA